MTPPPTTTDVDSLGAHRLPPAPFAGMTRIRFNGRWRRHPLSPLGLPCSLRLRPRQAGCASGA